MELNKGKPAMQNTKEQFDELEGDISRCNDPDMLTDYADEAFQTAGKCRSDANLIAGLNAKTCGAADDLFDLRKALLDYAEKYEQLSRYAEGAADETAKQQASDAAMARELSSPEYTGRI